MADILRPIQPGDSWVTDEFGNVTGVALSLTGQQTKLPRLTNSSTTPTASQQTALVSGTPINSTSIGATSASTGAFTTLSASSTVSGAGFTNYMAAPPSIGTTTPGIVKTINLQATYTDSSGTPGNVTNNSPRGRAAFAAASATVTVTSSLVTATSSVFVQQETADATLTTILSVVPAAGSFTVTGNAAAIGTTKFSFFVVN